MYNVFTHDKNLEIQQNCLKSNARQENRLLKSRVKDQTLAGKHQQYISSPKVPLI